jgi:hypothetical protein
VDQHRIPAMRAAAYFQLPDALLYRDVLGCAARTIMSRIAKACP